MSELNHQFEKRLSRNLVLFERGLLSAREVAQDFIGSTIASGLCQAVVHFDRLPEPVQVEVATILHNLRSEGYAWQPLVIGPPPESASTDFSRQLRQLDETLADSLTDIPVETTSSTDSSQGHA